MHRHFHHHHCNLTKHHHHRNDDDYKNVAETPSIFGVDFATGPHTHSADIDKKSGDSKELNISLKTEI